MISQGLEMTVGGAGGNNQIIRNVGLFTDVDGFDIEGFVFIKNSHNNVAEIFCCRQVQ